MFKPKRRLHYTCRNATLLEIACHGSSVLKFFFYPFSFWILVITGTLANREDPDEMPRKVAFNQGLHWLLSSNQHLGIGIHHYLELLIYDP